MTLPVLAATDPVVVPVFATTGALLLWLLATVLMPILVGLITRASTPPAVKSMLLVAASLINGLLTEALAAGAAYDWGRGALLVVVAFVVALATHLGVWRPVGATAAAHAAFDPSAAAPGSRRHLA
jgi:hypothetical protein